MSSEKKAPVPPEEIEGWVAEVKALLGLDDEIDIAAILDLATDLAHNVARPAPPVTAFVLGLALGRSDQGVAAFGPLAERIRTRSFEWQQD